MKSWFWQTLILCSVIFLNLSLSYLVRTLGLFYIPNQFPFGLSIGPLSATLILLFVTWGVFALKLFDKSPVFTLLILAGGWSNLLERFILGSATDYIMFFISFINLADIQIWIGLILLNIQIWFWPIKKPDVEKGI